MNLNRKFPKTFISSFSILLFTICFFFLTFSRVNAADPSFSFFPPGGRVMNKDQGFIVDVLIDTAGEEILSAKFTVLFDPELLQLRKAERNNSLFAQFPEEESTIDNENGVVMLSGFTQSGTDDLYVTGDKPDIMARLTFDTLQEGEATLDWEYGEGVSFETAMYTDGSPPQNILLSKPDSVVFEIGERIYDPNIPDTGIDIDKYILATGIVLVLFGGFMVFTKPGGYRRKSGTVIIHEDEETDGF